MPPDWSDSLVIESVGTTSANGGNALFHPRGARAAACVLTGFASSCRFPLRTDSKVLRAAAHGGFE